MAAALVPAGDGSAIFRRLVSKRAVERRRRSSGKRQGGYEEQEEHFSQCYER